MAQQPLKISDRRPDQPRTGSEPPPSIPFPTAEERERAAAAKAAGRTPRNPRTTADDVLRLLDHLSLTLDDLRREVDDLDSDWPKPAA